MNTAHGLHVAALMIPLLGISTSVAAQDASPAPTEHAAGNHWAFAAPNRPALPETTDPAWQENPIDRFVWRALDAADARPSPLAEHATLIRRLSLALTGLPPTLTEVEAFANATSPDAVSQLVDRLLASPHYGERMAKWWLDLARFADTDGFHIDGHRDMWKWRDWVINAFNSNKPFDEFTIDQIAGDLLPNRSTEQLVATGFNRNNMTNIEGGADPEEYSVRYVVDRANTTSTVWMGLTMKCAECHDHKYDPITQKDYYRFFALFNNVPERGLDGYFGNAAPLVPLPTPDQQRTLTGLQKRILSREKDLEDIAPQLIEGQQRWESDLLASDLDTTVDEGLLLRYVLDAEVDGIIPATQETPQPAVLSGAGSAAFGAGKLETAIALDGIGTHIDCGPVADFERTDAFTVSAWVNIANGGSVVAKYDDDAGERGFDFAVVGHRPWLTLSHDIREDALRVMTLAPITPGKWYHVLATYDGSGKAAGAHIFVDGVESEVSIEQDNLTRTIRCDEPLRIGRRSIEYGFQGAIDDVRVFDRVLDTREIANIAVEPAFLAATTPPDKRTDSQREELRTYYADHVSPEVRAIRDEIAPLVKERNEMIKEIPTSMIMDELAEPRPAHVLIRGDYRRKGETVGPGVPAALTQLNPTEKADRLAFARWLTQADNPLTSRVLVNRVWQLLFGAGLVKTTDDFGARGERPSHPQLLDWLAAEFVESGWDVKHLVRLIVTSRTFCQTSAFRGEIATLDPENRLLGRSPRLRLDAETIRDNALAVAGLLDRRIGGPSVRPYQPPGLWEEIAFGGSFPSQTYEQSGIEDLYRRGLYVYWKRSSPYASFLIFDAPTRELCTVQRSVTNTPLQALALMNDPVYLEIARAFAVRMLDEGGSTTEERIGFGIRLATAREPRQREIEVLGDLIERQAARFRADGSATNALLSIGEFEHPARLDNVELATWTVIASTLLNTSEAITRP